MACLEIEWYYQNYLLNTQVSDDIEEIDKITKVIKLHGKEHYVNGIMLASQTDVLGQICYGELDHYKV